MPTAESDIFEGLRPFRCIRLKVDVRASNRIELPPYLGSTLRGAFGMALRQTCCTLRRQECSTCLLRTRCIYSYTFETPSNGHAEKDRRYSSAPHPFVLNLDTDPLGVQETGSNFSFGVTLIGRAADFLPYFVYAFQRMGQLGIGRGRGTFEVTAVSVLDAAERSIEMIFDGDELRLPKTCLRLEDALGSLETFPLGPLRLRLITPLRLVESGELCDKPHFPVIIRNLLRRLNNLISFHCNLNGELPYGELLDRAESVRLVRSSTRWHDWERYSKRQDRRMKLGGLVGEVTYEGDTRPFLPLLALGEWVNIGKGTSFGLGRYRVERHSTGF